MIEKSSQSHIENSSTINYTFPYSIKTAISTYLMVFVPYSILIGFAIIARSGPISISELTPFLAFVFLPALIIFIILKYN